VGSADGFVVGAAVGPWVGEAVGLLLGLKVGSEVGASLGAKDRLVDGRTVGSKVGDCVGLRVAAVGRKDGFLVGSIDVGRADGLRVGAVVGFPVVGASVWQVPSADFFVHVTSPNAERSSTGPPLTVYRYQSSRVTPAHCGNSLQSACADSRVHEPPGLQVVASSA
jgi:hypothetical protein